MGTTDRRLAATLLSLGLMGLGSGVMELLASQPPGAPVGLLALPAPWATLRATALWHAALFGALGALRWLPEARRRVFWWSCWLGLGLLHGAMLYGATQGYRLVVLWPLRPDVLAAVAARWLGQLVVAGALLSAVASRLRPR